MARYKNFIKGVIGMKEKSMEKEKPIDFEHILNVYKPLDVALIKSILEANEIVYFVQGEQFSTLHGGLMGVPMRVLVRGDQKEMALELLKDFK